MAVLAMKTPPQPLPTRGRGLPAATARQDRNLSTGTKMKCGNSTAPRVSPSPLWGGVGEGTSAAPTEAVLFLRSYRRAKITPLCPAGHLPHKGGDWLGVTARSTFVGWLRASHESISPLVGEMPGRAEGGTAPTNLSNDHTHQPTTRATGHHHLTPKRAHP